MFKRESTEHMLDRHKREFTGWLTRHKREFDEWRSKWRKEMNELRTQRVKLETRFQQGLKQTYELGKEITEWQADQSRQLDLLQAEINSLQSTLRSVQENGSSH